MIIALPSTMLAVEAPGKIGLGLSYLPAETVVLIASIGIVFQSSSNEGSYKFTVVD